MKELDVFTSIGIIFILLGIAFLLIPLLVKYLLKPEILEKIPPIIIYIYKSNGFYFVTSPILIIISLLFLLLSLLKH
jgi:hypothetical protein